MRYEYTIRDHLGNSRVMFSDPDGRAPEEPIYDEDGTLVAYRVEAGQGPTQIAADINTNYSCDMTCSVNYTDIVHDNRGDFGNALDGGGNALGKSAEEFKSGNIEPGDVLVINGGIEGGRGKVAELEGGIQETDRKIDSMKNEVQNAETSVWDNDNIVKETRSSPNKRRGGIGAQAGAASNSIWKTNELNKEKRVLQNLERKQDSLKTELKKTRGN